MNEEDSGPSSSRPSSSKPSSSKPVSLGDLQLAIMRVLWERDEASVSDVHTALLPERGLAPTTIATMLVKLERRGVIDHRVEGRKFIYRPTVSQHAVRRSMVSELTSRLFEGDVAALVSHLISEHDADPETLAELKRRIEERTLEESE